MLVMRSLESWDQDFMIDFAAVDMQTKIDESANVFDVEAERGKLIC